LTLAIKGNLLTYLVPGALNRPNTVFLLLLLLLLLLMMMMMKMMLMMVVVACWWRGVYSGNALCPINEVTLRWARVLSG